MEYIVIKSTITLYTHTDGRKPHQLRNFQLKIYTSN